MLPFLRRPPAVLEEAPPVRMLPRLKAIREDRAFSQEDLGRLAGINPDTVGRIEGGKPAQPRTIRKLAEALGVTPRQLMGLDD